MKKKFHFKEIFSVPLEDILSFLGVVIILGGFICLTPFLMASILNYFNICDFEIAFSILLILEILVARVYCFFIDLKEKYYY